MNYNIICYETNLRKTNYNTGKANGRCFVLPPFREGFPLRVTAIRILFQAVLRIKSIKRIPSFFYPTEVSHYQIVFSISIGTILILRSIVNISRKYKKNYSSVLQIL